MPPSTLRYLSTIAGATSWVIERVEVRMSGVSEYLLSLGTLIRQIQEADADDPSLDALWVTRSRFLYSVREFHRASLIGALEALGGKKMVGQKWGDAAAREWESAHSAGLALSGGTSALREEFGQRVRLHEYERSQRVKIFCHRAHAPDFDVDTVPRSIYPLHLVHSLAEYRKVDMFDVLFKVGPLHNRGLGQLPDAILIAPKFNRLVQCVWAGTHDVRDYPLQPLTSAVPRWDGGIGGGVQEVHLSLSNGIVWKRETEWVGTSISVDVGPEEDLGPIHDGPLREEAADNCDAILVSLGGGFAVLLAPGGRELTYSESSVSGCRAGLRSLLDSGEVGLWWARQSVTAPDLAALTANEGMRSLDWKHRLECVLQEAPLVLEQCLRDKGVGIEDLQARMQEWCKIGRSVITAPKTRSNFMALLRAIQPWDHDMFTTAKDKTRWINEAWLEVSRSRSAAINTGVVEHELIDEELVSILESGLEPSMLHRPQVPPFILYMEPGTPLDGHVDLYPILAVDAGYSCPRSKLRHLMTLEEAAKWQG